MLNPIQLSLVEAMCLCREVAELVPSEQQQQPSVAEIAPLPASQLPESQAGEPRTGVPVSTNFIAVFYYMLQLV